MKAMITAASECGAPVILMSSAATIKFLGLKEIVYAFKSFAEDAVVPCVLHLDHGKDIELIKKAIDAGYTSVMIDASTKPFEENVELTRRVVEAAKKRGVSVEAELGTVAGREEDVVGDRAEYADPEKVLEFVERTQIDALAPSIGTAHGFYMQKPDIRFGLIEEIKRRTNAPLVMHGGTGLSEAEFKRAVECGISKINVGTEIKHAFSNTLRRVAGENAAGAHPHDYMSAVYNEIKGIVRGKMKIFGCENKYR